MHATFTTHGGRLRGLYGPECSGGIGQDAHAFSSDGMTTHPPLKLWPFAMCTAFPCSDYYGDSVPSPCRQPTVGLPAATLAG